MNIIDKRWERIKTINVDFNYIKNIVNDKFGYEIGDISLEDFIYNIDKYKNIEIDLLLHYIEKNYYSKVSILYMRKLSDKGNGPEYPVYDELLNPVFNNEFKRKNRIYKQQNQEYIGELDNCFKLTYYKETSKYVEIKMARIFNYSNIINNNGITKEVMKSLYDSFKIIIDLEEKLILMFYNDIPVSSVNQGHQYTCKKKAFYELFTKANKANILSFIISDALTEYFIDYLNEIENCDIKKRISLVEVKNLLGDKSQQATRSISHECNHDKYTIEAIKKLILDNNYHVFSLECIIKSNIIKLKYNGDITISNGIFSKEVLEIVCREFIKYHRLHEIYDV